jgi:hypothetical protein
MTQAMKLHGLRPRPIENYCSSMRRVAHYFDRCPGDLNPTELKEFFAPTMAQAGLLIDSLRAGAEGNQELFRRALGP